MESRGDLDGVVVVDTSTSLAGAYAAKLFADAGADVTRVEPADGDPMRRRRWDTGSGAPAVSPTEAGPLFGYLRHGQCSVTIEPGDAALIERCAAADLVIADATGPAGSAHDLADRCSGTVVCSISPWGTTGPYADRPATELTVQAESGAVALRGVAEFPPFQMGGSIVEWVGGAYAAVASLAAVRRSRSTGHGELIDVSLAEVANLTGTVFTDLFHSLAGRRPVAPGVAWRSMEIPSIEPTLDGWVGFNTNTRAQWEAFCLLIEQPDLIADGEFASLSVRLARADEWNALVRAWTTRHRTADIVEQAAALRIPVAPVADGPGVLGLDHAIARGVFVDDPTGSFRMPRRPWTIDAEPAPAPGPAPAVGEHTAAPVPQRRDRPDPAPSMRVPLPLAGITVLDLTAWWAGPSAAGLLAALGADVIHVESTRRIDGMRTAGGAFASRGDWWEYSAFFLQINTNKRAITVDLDHPDGRALALELVGHADVVIENFTPRVLESFDLDWPVIHATNPSAIMVRMPAFGLDGPWRDRPGFAQTMEQVTGLAWMTGHPEDQPRIQRGPCDPNGGLHAAFATLVALERRSRTGIGCLVEAPMFEAALAVAAEPVLEWSAHGVAVERMGNRSPSAAPQNLYPTAETEQWLALSCATDAEWQALTVVIGRPDLAADPALRDLAGRRRHHDRLDEAIEAWSRTRRLDDAVAELLGAGVPAGATTDTRRSADHPQMAARGFFETVEHPVVGTHPTPGAPFRYASVDRWIRTPAPTLGQHGREIIGGLLGRTDDELDALEAAGVIGTRPHGL
jgi:crotonobetainyl-CoA:carnitine CoA-transferase CaiB-like acyl-CoA transferase